MRLPATHRQFLIGDHGIGPTVVNGILNGGIGWLLFRSHELVPLRGSPDVPIDLVATAFLIPFATAIVATAMVLSQVRRGKVPPLGPEDVPTTGWSCRPRWKRGVLLGALGVAIFAVPSIVGMQIAGPTEIPLWTFVKAKAAFGAAVAAVVSPPVGWWALEEASRRAHGLE